MGCDIHCHAEIKINGVWHHYNELCIKRNYKLFAFLAGVRAEESDRAFPVRGLPKDLSVVTKVDADRWHLDAHTHSWIGIEEIEKTIGQFPSLSGRSLECDLTPKYLFGNSYEYFRKYRDEYPKEIQNIRWVFWFDN